MAILHSKLDEADGVAIAWRLWVAVEGTHVSRHDLFSVRAVIKADLGGPESVRRGRDMEGGSPLRSGGGQTEVPLNPWPERPVSGEVPA